MYSHRIAYELGNGPIPEGYQVMHKCDNRACCNPKHLIPGNNKANIADSVKKGRRKGVRRRAPLGTRRPRKADTESCWKCARDRIVDLDRVGISKKEIAAWLGCCVVTVYRQLDLYKKHGIPQ